jgi:hypothetical protein
MNKYLTFLFLFISFASFAEDIKLKCSMQISYSSTFDASEKSQENVVFSINKNMIHVENPGSRIRGLYRFSSPPKLISYDFSDSSKWSVSNQDDSVPVFSASTQITIDRNTGNVSYRATHVSIKSGINIGSTEVRGSGTCEKVDVTKRKF